MINIQLHENNLLTIFNIHLKNLLLLYKKKYLDQRKNLYQNKIFSNLEKKNKKEKQHNINVDVNNIYNDLPSLE